MTLSNIVREEVRRRANFACEYCGVTETDSGGSLTIDHFQPQSQGGSDALTNLVYCCHRCNEYKSDYWPQSSSSPALWNPRLEASSVHFIELVNGTLHAITAIGRFTLQRLRLNRPALVAHRLQEWEQREQQRRLRQYKEVIALLQRVREQEVSLIEEQQNILEEQRRVIRALLDLG
jgi:hypothetical protein